MKKTLLIILALSLIGINYAQHNDMIYANQNNYIQTFGGGQGKNTFIKFDISTIPPNAIVTGVTFSAYVFNSQPAWDGDMRYIRYNNQTWIETDSNQYIWNTLLFTDTVLQPIGFGMVPGYSMSPDLSVLFMVDFAMVNTYFSLMLKDPDDGTFAPMMPGASFTNTDSMLVGNIFNNRTAFRPRLYANPNQWPFLMVSYNVPPTTSIFAGGVYCEENALILVPSIAGDSPLTYQWLHDGVPMAGETNDSLIINSLALSDSGGYSIIVTNPFGVDTSNQTWISVSPLNINSLGNDTTVCYSDNLVLDAGAGYASYAWSPGGATTQTLNVDTASMSSDTTTITVMVLKLDGCFSYDTVTVILDPCGSGIGNSEADLFNIYPNPHEGNFNIHLNEPGKESTLEIFNGLGEIIFSRKIGPGTLNIPVNISDLPDGIYFIRLYNDQFNHTEKTIRY